MKKTLVLFLCFAAIISRAVTVPAYAVGDDMQGHWAEETLRDAVEKGLILGFDDGTVRPDSNITDAQVITLLCRVLNVSERETELPLEDTWFAPEAAKAYSLGILKSGETVKNEEITRGEVFKLTARAYQLYDAEPDYSVIERFSDSEKLSGEELDACVAMVSRGFVEGYGTTLKADNYITRAEFLTILYRIGVYSTDSISGLISGETTLYDGSESINGAVLESVWYTCDTKQVSLLGVTAENVVVRSERLDSFNLSSNKIDRLVLAEGSGKIDILPYSGKIGTVVLGDGNGDVTIYGGTDQVEITGSGRSVLIDARLKNLVISGDNNTVTVQSGSAIDELRVLGKNNTVILEGTVKKLNIFGIGSDFSGYGFANELIQYTENCNIAVRYGTKTDNIDYGISGTEIAVVTDEILPAGDTLKVRAEITSEAIGKVCRALWYVDGEVISEAQIVITGKDELEFTYGYKYEKNMEQQGTVKLSLIYNVADGSVQTIEAEAGYKIENYPPEYYEIEVTTGYKGDFTLAWAQEHDYPASVKINWINDKGYESETDYLLWVNITYQRINIFTRDENGDWELFRSSIVATGAPGSPTPVGVWKTTYKQPEWVYDNYICAPVVRFKGGGYAFHSRLLSVKRDGTYYNDSIGYPMSHGCIRMYDEDIQWLYDNVPSGTTVVVY